MKSYVLGVKTIERIVIEMEIESPCRVCKRINDDKRVCAAECPAVELYRKVCEIDYASTSKGLENTNKKLKKLADDHASQFTEEHTDPAEMMSGSDENGETFMADIEIDPGLSDELDIDETQKPSDETVGADAFPWKPKNQKNAEMQQDPSEGTMTKKRKYTKKKTVSGDSADASGASEAIVLDMSKYPQIARLLKVMSEETMLPQEHIVMSFIGKGLSSE